MPRRRDVKQSISTETPAPEGADRWVFLRDVLVFQMKLFLDAVRDLMLSPVSIIAGVIDLISGHEPLGRYFYRVLTFGGRTETWINLFGKPGRTQEPGGDESITIDSLVAQVERLVVDQYERGGVTASAKQAIDRSLDAISRKTGN
jgi:hypothetical protein